MKIYYALLLMLFGGCEKKNKEPYNWIFGEWGIESQINNGKFHLERSDQLFEAPQLLNVYVTDYGEVVARPLPLLGPCSIIQAQDGSYQLGNAHYSIQFRNLEGAEELKLFCVVSDVTMNIELVATYRK